MKKKPKLSMSSTFKTKARTSRNRQNSNHSLSNCKIRGYGVISDKRSFLLANLGEDRIDEK